MLTRSRSTETHAYRISSNNSRGAIIQEEAINRVGAGVGGVCVCVCGEREGGGGDNFVFSLLKGLMC